MNLTKRKLRILIALGLIAFLLLPVTILLLGREQNTISQAATGTTLTFEPASSDSVPLEATTGQEVAVDLVAIPGESNSVSFVKFVIEYDPEFIEVRGSESFEPNTDAFPEVLEDVVVDNGIVTGSVSIGSDYTKAVEDPTVIGTLTVIAKKDTVDNPAVIAYTADSQVLSVGEGDQTNKNVLSNTDAAFIAITKGTDAPLPDKTTEDTTDEPDTEDDETGPRPRFPANAPKVEPNEGDTTLLITALLHGVGSSGDSTNPKNSSQSNKNPKKPTRVAAAAIWDEEDYLVSEGFIPLTYNKSTGKYEGTFATDSPLPDAPYAITVTVEGYLTGVLEEQKLTEGEENKLAEIEFVAGDIYPDEVLDIVDYNILSDCGYGSLTPLPMDNPQSLYNSEACKAHDARADADLDNNGTIDAKDFNLFLREFAAQKKLEAEEVTPEIPTPTPTKTAN